MDKGLKIILLITLIIIPLVFYAFFKKGEFRKGPAAGVLADSFGLNKPKVALIFDDLGESLSDLRGIYSLDIPVTVSVIPGLRFSKNIAHIALRCEFSVFIHLPLQPKEEGYRTDKYKFISSSLNEREIDSLLRYYLNYLRIAIGVNNHMGSAATENEQLMKVVLRAIKRKGLIFVDSRTSLSSCAYEVAEKERLVSGYNEGFLDSVGDAEKIEKKLGELIEIAKNKGKIIFIAHPKKDTIKVLKKNLPSLKEKIEFVTIKDYFGL